MTNKIVFVTDSSAYIPKEALEGLNVSIIPLWLIWDGESLQDTIDITPQAFYRRLKNSKTMPTTSQPTPGEFKSFFQKVAESADSIVAIMVSSQISGTYESAVIAYQPLGEGADSLVVFAVDQSVADREKLIKELNTKIKEELNTLFKIYDLVLTDQLPRTASNKLMRRTLRDKYLEMKNGMCEHGLDS